MKENSRAHHRGKERTDVLQFDKKKVKRGAYAYSRKRTIQKQGRQSIKKECGHKKDRIIVISGIFLFTVIITGLFEYCFYDHVGLVDFVGSTLALLGLFISISADADRPVYYDETNFFKRVIDGILWFKDVWRSKPVFTFLLVALLVLNGSAVLSQYEICSRIVYAAEKGATAFLKYEKRTCAKSGNDQGILGTSTVYSKQTSEEKVNNDIENSAAEDSPYIFTEEEMIEQYGRENYLVAKNIIVTKDDREKELNLSPSHYNDIFHQEGEFKIEDWSDQEAIDAVVLQMVQDDIGMKKENRFDEAAPRGLRDEVDAASKREEKEHTFSERIEIMGTRAGAYGLHPKSSLAKLVSNDNHALALVLVLIGGKKQTKMYYFGEAIIWGREYIGFADVSANSIKEKLNWIAERYKDIRSICSESDPEYLYADRLMKAYQHAADEF